MSFGASFMTTCGPGPDPCSDSRANFTFLFPGQTARSDCAAIPSVSVAFVLTRSGVCAASSTIVTSDDARFHVGVLFRGGELFANPGVYPVGIEFRSLHACPPGVAPCAFAGECSLQVT